MVTAVAVGMGQMARRDEAPAEEEGKTTTPPPPGLRRPRQPTPDHPPYCWMIGEAIDKLEEDGGSAEDSISSFIRAAHPGVPAAHDRFLRHYLARHVAEGFFVRTAQGRYARSTGETAAGSSQAARVETPVAQVKRGRGRPRKDGSSPPSAPHAVKKDGSGGSATPKRRGRPPRVALLTSGDGSVPSSSVAALAVIKKDTSAASPPAVRNDGSGQCATPKRRGRPRALAPLTSADGSVPSSSVAALAIKKDGSSSAPAAVKKDGSRECATPKRRGRCRGVASLTPGDGSVQSSSVAAVAAADESGSQATASVPRRRRRPRKLATITEVSDEAPVTEKEDDGIDAPSLELALVAVGDGLATTPTVDNNVCGEAPPTMPVERDEPCVLALMAAADVPAPMRPMDKQDDGEGEKDIPGTSTAPEHRCQAGKLAIVAVDDGPVPWLVADETDGDEAPSKHTDHRRASPMVTPAQGPDPTSAAGNKARGKTLSVSATPKAKDRRQHKLPLAATVSVPAGGGNGLLLIEGPHRLYPLTADEIPDDPSWCLLALPAPASGERA